MCSWTRIPCSIATRRRPRARRAGWTVPPSSTRWPPSNTGERTNAVERLLVEHAVAVLDPELTGDLEGLVPAAGLGGRRGDADVALAAEPGVDAVGGHPLLELVDGPGAGLDTRDGALAAEQVEQGPGVVVEAVDESAVAAGRAEAALVALEDDDVDAGLELPEVPGGPEARVAAADDDDVGRRVALAAAGAGSPRNSGCARASASHQQRVAMSLMARKGAGSRGGAGGDRGDGAPGGIRTHDPQLRKLVLYPLSYGRTRDVRGGEGGIRTLGAGYPTRRFSKPLH